MIAKVNRIYHINSDGESLDDVAKRLDPNTPMVKLLEEAESFILDADYGADYDSVVDDVASRLDTILYLKHHNYLYEV